MTTRRNGGRVMRTARPRRSTRRTGLEQAGDLPVPDRDLGRRRRLPGQRRGRGHDRRRRPERHGSRPPAGLTVPTDREVSLTGSHIRPQPGYGYDERRHVTVWGPATIAAPTRRRSRPHAPGAGTRPRSRSSSIRSARSASRARYFDALSAERGTPVKPRLSFGFLTLRTTRLPFLTATIVPVAARAS